MERRQQQISAKKVVVADHDPNFDRKFETLTGTVLDG